MTKDTNIEIVPWHPRYTEWLRHAISQFFQAGLARGGDLLDTERNVTAYFNLGIVGASKGDPCLVALVAGEPVAYVLWVGSPDVLDSEFRTLNAIGSYTEPAHRNRLVASALRERALQLSRAAGYTRVQGPVHNTNTRGLQEFCVTYGAWPVSTNFELLL